MIMGERNEMNVSVPGCVFMVAGCVAMTGLIGIGYLRFHYLSVNLPVGPSGTIENGTYYLGRGEDRIRVERSVYLWSMVSTTMLTGGSTVGLLCALLWRKQLQIMEARDPKPWLVWVWRIFIIPFMLIFSLITLVGIVQLVPLMFGH